MTAARASIAGPHPYRAGQLVPVSDLLIFVSGWCGKIDTCGFSSATTT
jgi:hypothetical protein